MSRIKITNRPLIRNFSNSLYFSGVSGANYVDITDSALNPGTGSFWMACSIKLGAISLNPVGDNCIFSFQNFQSTSGYSLYIIANGLRLDFNNSINQFAAFGKAYTNNIQNFLRLFVVCNATTNKIIGYVNGSQTGSITPSSTWNVTSGTTTPNLMEIGAFNFDGHQGNMNAYLNDVQFGVGYAPTATDVKNDYVYGTVAQGCLHRYPLTEGSGTTAIDIVGSINGTISGCAFNSTLTAGKSRKPAIGRKQEIGRVKD